MNDSSRRAGTVSSMQLAALMLFVSVDPMVRTASALLVRIAGQEAWLAMLVGLALDLLIAAELALLGHWYRGQTMLEYPQAILGRVFGWPVGVAFALFFAHVGSTSLWELSEFAGRVFLPETPALMVAVLIASLCTYAAWLGLDTFARLAELLAPLFVLGFVLMVAMASPAMEFVNLRSPFEQGLGPPLRAGLLPASLLGVCIVVGALLPYHGDAAGTWKAKAVGVSAAVFIVTITMLTAVAMFGPVEAGRAGSVVMPITKTIRLGDLIQRLELFWVGAWITAAVVSLTTLTWAAATGLARAFGVPDYRWLLVPLNVLVVAAGPLTFQNLADLDDFWERAYPIYALSIEFGLVTLLLVVAALRRPWRGGGGDGAIGV